MSRSATSGELNKAIIHVLDARGEKKYEVPVLFYPSEYTVEKGNEFANINIPGLEAPLLQYTRGSLGTLSMDLFFDSYEEGKDVREYTNKISNLLKLDPDLHAPPVLKFVWGDSDAHRSNFYCVLARVNKSFTMFRSDGVPVRAKLSVTFNEFKTADEMRRENPPRSSDRTKVYTVKQGDSLWSIAAREYGDPTLWRPIADKNGLENPRFIEVGREIIIPPIDKKG